MSVLDVPGLDPLQIGPVTFNSIECPSALPIGAVEVELVISKRIGGGRETQNMGSQFKPVQIRGTFYQPNVDKRVSDLSALFKNRNEVPLRWRTQQFFCKVKDFTPSWRHANICDYDITVEITRSSNGALVAASPKSVDTQVQALAGNAVGQNAIITNADPTGSSTFQQTLTTALTAIQQYAPIAQLLAPQLTGLINTVAGAAAAVSSYQATVSESAPHWVATQQLITSLTLIAQNIAQGQAVRTVRTQGESFFELAALHYGNANLGFPLAQANKSASMYTSSYAQSDIILPPIQSFG